MKSAEEWAREAMTPHGHRFSSVAQAIREARNEALEEAANLALAIGIDRLRDTIAAAIRKLKDEP